MEPAVPRRIFPTHPIVDLFDDPLCLCVRDGMLNKRTDVDRVLKMLCP